MYHHRHFSRKSLAGGWLKISCKSFFLCAALLFVGSRNVFSQEKLKAEGEIPILGWLTIPENESAAERFKELKNAGLTIILAEYSNLDNAMKALNAAHKAGVKIQTAGLVPELQQQTEQTVKKLMKHPALAGYHLGDEYHADKFASVGDWMRRIQAVDSKHYCYVNLLPNLGMGDAGPDGYRAHLEAFVKEVPAPFISFDFYPVRDNIGLHPWWYRNLEEIRNISLEVKKPFWAFALSSAHWNFPIPSVAELRLQMFSNLAYGAQGLQYFTYWGSDGNHTPIANGKRTDVYDRVKQVNSEIQNLAGVFLNSRVVSVWHTGEKIPDRTKRFTPDVLPPVIKRLETCIDEEEHATRGGEKMHTYKPLDASKEGAVISLIEKKNNRFLAIINRDYKKPMWLDIETDASVKKVLKDGTVVPASLYSSRLVVDPGDMVVYMWDEK